MSHTTRKPVSVSILNMWEYLVICVTFSGDINVNFFSPLQREGEKDGVHYNFTSVDEIKKDIDGGKFVEYAEVHGNYYGTR